MVIKTFWCGECALDYDVEMGMDEKTALCPVHGFPMERVFNMSVSRPGEDGRGFYGSGMSTPSELGH